ncbi:histone H1 [Mucilaginibacter pedocola]|uniref:Histone H1 n=1 Tax=Mucilaginibacter pedocola TaxID=1792845 RepID=A0A1S9PCV8_9SPHI|nr:histone H1 [Mucilaginibacter pedocola]OOQ58770.1 histone H1 [Mucilaginibacter pedocola]
MATSGYAQLKTLIEEGEADAEKFYNKGNQAAGVRLRIKLQQVRKLAQEIRQEITAIKRQK